MGTPTVIAHATRRRATDPTTSGATSKAGRLRHRTLTPKQAELMRLAIANYRKTKKLLRTWEAHTQRLIELNAPE